MAGSGSAARRGVVHAVLFRVELGDRPVALIWEWPLSRRCAAVDTVTLAAGQRMRSPSRRSRPSCLRVAGGAPQPTGRCAIVALGDSLTAGFGLPAERRFRPSCSGRSPPRASPSRSPMRRFRRYGVGRARAARLVGAGRHRRGHPRARRQRRAARLDPADPRARSTAILRAARGAPHPGAPLPACWRRPISAPTTRALQRDLSRSRQEVRRVLYPFFLDGVAADPQAQPARRPASDRRRRRRRSSRRSCPRSKSSLPRRSAPQWRAHSGPR